MPGFVGSHAMQQKHEERDWDLVAKTAMFIWCCLSWVLLAGLYLILSGALGCVVGFLTGGIVGYILALLLKLFSRGRFPSNVRSFVISFAATLAVIVGIVFAIAGIFEFLPRHLPK